MLKLYNAHQNGLKLIKPSKIKEEFNNLVWIDLFKPTTKEEHTIEKLLGINIPTRAEMQEIELSSRLYQENGALYVTTNIVVNPNSFDPQSNAITFVLIGDRLITVRYSDPLPFREFIKRVKKGHKNLYNGSKIFTSILEAIVNRIADILEQSDHNITIISRQIFRPKIVNKMDRAKTKPDFEEMLRLISINSDLISMIKESLVNINRLVSFVLQVDYFNKNSDEHLKACRINSDILPLNEHTTFLSNKVTFLLDATLGMISIEQNKIIKIFSIASVVFLPPTLVASIYGMNFEIIPELKWHYGYPLALIIMIISSYLPYKFFKKMQWF